MTNPGPFSLTSGRALNYFPRPRMIKPSFSLLVVLILVTSGALHSSAQKRKPKAKTPPASVAIAKPTTATKTNPALALLSAREKQLLEEINSARANPNEFVKVLEAFRKHFRGKNIHYPEGGVLVTNEGVEALDDAIKFLRDAKPAPPLELRKGMVQAAKSHATDLASSNKFGHRGSDGSKPDDRISRYGTWDDTVGENIVYDSRTSRYDVIGMLIDDGTSNRGHRKNLFKEDFEVIGVAIAQRANGTSLAVITFAGGLVEK
jgi:uncharacterized protein YkwD